MSQRLCACGDRLSYCASVTEINTVSRSSLGRRGLISAYTSQSPSITESEQGLNAETEAME